MSRRYSLSEELRRASREWSGDDFSELALLEHHEDREVNHYGSVVANETDGSCVGAKLLSNVSNNEEKDRRLSLLGETELLQDELKSIVTLAIPIISTYLLELIPGIVTIMLVGRADHGGASLTQLYLDAAALANMWVNITALSTGFGEPCGSHACGDENKLLYYNQVFSVPWTLSAQVRWEPSSTARLARTY